MIIKEVDLRSSVVFQRLAQNYEAEFSAITRKHPDSDGLYALDFSPEDGYTGFMLYMENRPAGFAVVGVNSGRNDVAEFYIVPSMRRKALGKAFAYAVFDSREGEWQVRQIEGAAKAREFWRAVISEYTQGAYQETEVVDEYWGLVTRQVFRSSAQSAEKACLAADA